MFNSWQWFIVKTSYQNEILHWIISNTVWIWRSVCIKHLICFDMKMDKSTNYFCCFRTQTEVMKSLECLWNNWICRQNVRMYFKLLMLTSYKALTKLLQIAWLPLLSKQLLTLLPKILLVVFKSKQLIWIKKRMEE